MNLPCRLKVQLLTCAIFVTFSCSPLPALLQNETLEEVLVEEDSEAEIQTPDKVEVEPVAGDEDISGRLKRIYDATGWFQSVEVATEEGVVIISGVTDTEPHREWAERVAQKTSDVIAVVNRIEVKSRPIWDIEPALTQLRQLGRSFVSTLPLLIVGLVFIVLTYYLARLFSRWARYLTSRRVDSELIQQVVGSIVIVLVMLVGAYIALKVSGLTRLAMTILGGTGLVGLAIGFAFRDIAENYLASILISLNRPFTMGDLIEVEGQKGFVRRVTTRGTLLLTLDGNHIQIPNSTVYKSVITNYSSSPRSRQDFIIGIGYDDSVTEAQQTILEVLNEHETVLDDPAPLVLVDSLGSSTVNLLVRFWLDAERFDAPSVCSALMRQAKTALTEANISMPDEAREVVFPNGVPIISMDEPVRPPSTDQQPSAATGSKSTPPRVNQADKANSTDAEGELRNIADSIQSHAAEVESEADENLIE